MRIKRVEFLFVAALPTGDCTSGPVTGAESGESKDPGAALQFEVDPGWPAPLPNNWILGQVSGVAADSQDHIWIVHRPRSLDTREAGAVQNPAISLCCVPAPSVIEFDQEGNVVQAWGGRSWDRAKGEWVDTEEKWPASEHGIFVDHQSNVWIGGNDPQDQVVLKFDSKGKRLLTIGQWGATAGSQDTQRLGQPSDIAVDRESGEVYVSDGYGNRRIGVFDAETGAYRRHWGAYGQPPRDGELPPYDPATEPLESFRNPVHAVRISEDGLVYVADRSNNRIQVFHKNGTFVAEKTVAAATLGSGSVWDLDFSPDLAQQFLYVADGTNMRVWILRRNDLEVVGHFGRGGRQAGQFEWVHNLAVDSKGNVYTTEVNNGKRIQKFRPLKGVRN